MAVPLYEMKATAGNVEIFHPQHLTEENILYLPMLKGSDFAVTVFGESMEPIVENGDIVAVKEKNYKELSAGKIYMIDAGSNLYIKYVYLHEKQLILTSENKTHIPVIIPIKEVRKLYEITWVVKVRKV